LDGVRDASERQFQTAHGCLDSFRSDVLCSDGFVGSLVVRAAQALYLELKEGAARGALDGLFSISQASLHGCSHALPNPSARQA
jgi:hypothetical protein